MRKLSHTRYICSMGKHVVLSSEESFSFYGLSQCLAEANRLLDEIDQISLAKAPKAQVRPTGDSVGRKDVTDAVRAVRCC